MSNRRPAFAADAPTRRYYDQRAGEYDEWYENSGRYTSQERSGWSTEVGEVIALLRRLPPRTTLDVACGTAYLTQHLSGIVVGLDQSPSMLMIARSRLSHSLVILGDALCLSVTDHAVERVFSGHFYGHLPPGERAQFLAESRRVADEMVVVDAARRPDLAAEQWQERILNDGSRHRVYKRYLTGEQLAEEIGGEVLMDGEWFVAAQSGVGDNLSSPGVAPLRRRALPAP